MWGSIASILWNANFQVTPVECGNAQHSAQQSKRYAPDCGEILNGMFMAPLHMSCAHVQLLQPPGDFELSLQVSVACHALEQPEWLAMNDGDVFNSQLVVHHSSRGELLQGLNDT